MPLFFQLVLFAVPGVLIYLGIHFWTPVFLKKGRSLLSTFFFFLWLPVIPLLPLALILFLLFEGGEIMWRGFILPLQEGVFGEIAWLVNGLMWAWLVHAGLKWHFIGMLPGMLIAPWVAQYTGNTFAAFIVHAGGNSILWILLVLGALGIGEKKEEKSIE